MPGYLNPKDIPETELYKETYPERQAFEGNQELNSRRLIYEGGTLAGMPLDILNRPIALAAPNYLPEQYSYQE